MWALACGLQKEGASGNLTEAFAPLLPLPHMKGFPYNREQGTYVISCCFGHGTKTCSRTSFGVSAVTKLEAEQSRQQH